MRELHHPGRLPRVLQCYPHPPSTYYNATTVQVVQHPSKSHSDTTSSGPRSSGHTCHECRDMDRCVSPRRYVDEQPLVQGGSSE